MQAIKNLNEPKGFAHRVDSDFKHKLLDLYDGDTMRLCYQCGTCTSTCPISRLIGMYRPNKIIELARLGIRDHITSNAFLFCSACNACTKHCPQGVKVHEVMQALKELAVEDKSAQAFASERFEEVLTELGKGMPFPVTYAWICLRPPENEAGSNAFDASIMKAFHSMREKGKKQETKKSTGEKGRVAVIGSGPAGLTAAWELALKGFAVTVFESLPEIGGMLSVGLPKYRLPQEIVDAEIDQIKALGVDIQTNTKVDQAFFGKLLDDKQYQSIFIATGAFLSRKLRIDGEALEGVVPALDLLNEYNTKGRASVGGKVVVIGGGNVAIDAAGAALRSGAESVQLYCLESKENMPSHKWEITEADEDGVSINPSWGPKSILGDGKKVTGVELIKCKSVLDENGRFAPVFDEKSTRTVEADTVVSAIGQGPDLSFLGKWAAISHGSVDIDPYTMETSLPGVYAGGDAASGTASLIDAVLAGKTAAASIEEYIRKNP